MAMTRRDAIVISGSTLASLSLGPLAPAPVEAQAAAAQEPWPDTLVERPLRQGFPAALPLNADGSARSPARCSSPISRSSRASRTPICSSVERPTRGAS